MAPVHTVVNLVVLYLKSKRLMSSLVLTILFSGLFWLVYFAWLLCWCGDVLYHSGTTEPPAQEFVSVVAGGVIGGNFILLVLCAIWISRSSWCSCLRDFCRGCLDRVDCGWCCRRRHCHCRRPESCCGVTVDRCTTICGDNWCRCSDLAQSCRNGCECLRGKVHLFVRSLLLTWITYYMWLRNYAMQQHFELTSAMDCMIHWNWERPVACPMLCIFFIFIFLSQARL